MPTTAFTLTSHWPEIIEKVRAGAVDGLAKSADKMKFEVIGEMQRSKSGRMYGVHRASAPGETPATDTGDYQESIDIVDAPFDLQVAIFPTVPYAMVLEFGGARMAPRPMWAPVGERLGGNDGQIVRIIADEIGRRLK